MSLYYYIEGIYLKKVNNMLKENFPKFKINTCNIPVDIFKVVKVLPNPTDSIGLET